MTYGLDNYIFTNPLSSIHSIILLFGVYRIGLEAQKLIINNFFLRNTDNNIYYYSFLVGTYIVSYFLYIFVILQIMNTLAFKILAISIYLLGLFSIINFLSTLKLFMNKLALKNFNNYHYVIIICLLGLMFISLSPITHADSLDYHVASSLNILNSGSFHKELLPMTSKLASIGETMLALGFALKLEQFGALLQFSALFSLIPVFLKKNYSINYLVLLTILVIPITIFFVSSPKPQLIECVASLLIFIFLVKGFSTYSKFQIKIIVSIIFFVLAINVLMKYSFIVSSSILYIFCVYSIFRKKLLKELFFLSLIIFTITILPNWIHRYVYFNTMLPDLLLSPLPINIYGYQLFHDLLSPNKFDIVSLVIPRSLGEISTIYGPILFLIFFVKRSSIKKYKVFYFVITAFCLIHIFLGSNLSRFFYEGYLCLMYIIIISEFKISKYFKGYKLLLNIQILIGILFIYISAFNLFPGSFNKNLREETMGKAADGYSLAKWVNKNIDKDSVILSSHRSISLYNNETYPAFFTWWIDFKNKKSTIYTDYIKKKKINKIIFYGKKLDYGPFKNCLGQELKYKKNVGRKVGRNPFNKGQKYDGWIYEFNYKMLPKCLVG